MIILGLGSNLSSSFGNRFENLKLALSFLEKSDVKIIKKSNFYETPSYPDKKNPKFINMVISADTHLSPNDLMSLLILTEKKLERKRNNKNDPRTCDIDIIDYNGQILNLKYKNFNLTIPHKKLWLRNFVLIPLQEIMPEWKHPKTNEMIKTLIKNLPDEDCKSILKIEKT